MQRIWVQLCGRNDTRWSSYSCISETERELGFYRHDQRRDCLPCRRGSVSGSSTKGVASDSGSTSIRQTWQTSYQHKVQCTYTWSRLQCDVHGCNVGTIPFKRSGLQSHLQNHFKFEFKWTPYAHLSLFTQFKLVKHEKIPYSESLHFSDNFAYIICPIWS